MPENIEQIALLTLEGALLASLVLGLFWLRRFFGLWPLFVALGVMQPIQVLLSASLYVDLWAGVSVSPGSVAMFSANLFALLLVYMREDAREARKVVYALLAANVVISAIYALVAMQISSPGVQNPLGLPETLFYGEARVMAVGTAVLFADAVLVIVVYEVLGRVMRRVVLARIFLTLALVLAFDTVAFTLGAFLGTREVGALLAGGLVGKTAAALFYSTALYAYLRWIDPHVITEPARLRDVFDALTYREKYEDQRREVMRSRMDQEQLRRAIFESVEEGLVVLSSSRVVLEMNPAAERLLGSRADVLGRPIDDRLAPPGALPHVCQEASERGPADRATAREFTLLCDGAELPVEVTVTSAAYSASEIFVLAVRDIAERKAAEERVRQAERLDAIGGLAIGVAHDFNNLLTAISAANEMRGDRARQIISDAVARAAGLTRQLLVMSRAELQKPRRIDLGELVDGFRGVLDRLIREDIDFDVEIGTDEVSVLADPSEIEQLLMNLVVNSVHSMPGRGKLRVAVTCFESAAPMASVFGELPAGRWGALEVRDSGAGMDAVTVAKAFDPFFTTKPSGLGTGLGLATVRRVVDALGGGVQVESELARGTTIRILLPREEIAGEKVATSPVDAGGVEDGLQENVLVCDDDPLVASVSTALLDGANFHTHEFTSPVEALAWIQKNGASLDVLVCDMVMPHMTGRELAVEARRLHPSLRVVHLSGYASESDRAGPQNDPIVAKPFRPEALVTAIRRTRRSAGSA